MRRDARMLAAFFGRPIGLGGDRVRALGGSPELALRGSPRRPGAGRSYAWPGRRGGNRGTRDMYARRGLTTVTKANWFTRDDGRTKYISALTGARFPAIMVIVISHFEFLQQYGNFGYIYWNFWHNATMGVDFFFIMSGFGMMLSGIKKDPCGTAHIGKVRDAFMFGWHHVKKLYPLYVTMLVIGLPYQVLAAVIDGKASIVKQLLKSILLFSIDLTLLQSLIGNMMFSHSLNGVCWFLSSLFCIYLISPYIMYFFKKYVRNPRAMSIGVIVCIVFYVITGVIFSYIDDISPFFDDLCYGSPFRRVFCVMAGMFLAQLYNFRKHNGTTNTSILINSGIFEYFFISLSILWFFTRTSSGLADTPSAYAIDMSLVSGDLYALSLEKGVISRLLKTEPIVYLGTISMYIFMTHYLIRMYVDFGVKLLGINCLVIGIFEAILILVLSILISIRQYDRDGKKEGLR